MTNEELQKALTPICNRPLLFMEGYPGFCHDDWQERGPIRYCNVFTLKDNQPVATLAISKGNDEEAIREATNRLRA